MAPLSDEIRDLQRRFEESVARRKRAEAAAGQSLFEAKTKFTELESFRLQSGGEPLRTEQATREQADAAVARVRAEIDSTPRRDRPSLPSGRSPASSNPGPGPGRSPSPGPSSPGVIDVQAVDVTNAPPPPAPARPTGRPETPAERFRRERPGRQARRQRAADETQARLNTAQSVANNPFTSRLSSEERQRIRDLDRAAGVLRSLDPSTVLPPAQEPKFVNISAQVVQEQRVLPAGTQTTLRERARALGQRADREFVGIREGLGRAEAAINRTRNIAARRQTDFGIKTGKCGGREQPRDSRGRFSTCG